MANNQIVDYEAIIKEVESKKRISFYATTHGYMLSAMKESLRLALPIILEHVAERATAGAHISQLVESTVWVNQSSITGQKDELEKILGL